MTMRGIDDNSSPSAAGSLEDVRYIRRSQAVAVRRRFPRLRRVFRWTCFAVFVLLPVGWGGYSLAIFALNSPRFRLTSGDDVKVSGNHYVSQEDILDALGMANGRTSFGMNVFRTSLEDAERRIEGLPWVRSATIVRSYPDRLFVDLTERVPVAFVNVSGQIRMVDEDGVLLDVPDHSKFDFPVLKGLNFQGNANDRKSRIHLYRKFMQETSDRMARAGWIVSEVDLSDAEDVQALLIQGQDTLLIHFGRSNFLARFDNFLTVLPQLRKDNVRIDSVDLRFQNQVVVNPVEAGAKSSAPTK